MTKIEKLNNDLNKTREQISALVKKEEEIKSKIEAINQDELNKIMREKSLSFEEVIKLISKID